MRPHHDRHEHHVELSVHDVRAMFNSLDPSPFRGKDLDDDAVEFIVSWAREYPLNSTVVLRIHVEEWPKDDPTDMMREAVHHYFAYRAQLASLDLRRMMRQARTSLAIGLFFLVGCLLISSYLIGDREGTLYRTLRESLTIAGWVAMWRPMQLYLYDWWPVRQRGRLYRKLSTMRVELSDRPKPPPDKSLRPK